MDYYKLVAGRRRPDGGWYPSWMVRGKSAAIDSAKEFFNSTGVPVMLVVCDEKGMSLKPTKIVKKQVREVTKRVTR